MGETTGPVVALLCRGSEGDRAIAMALVGAGFRLAIGTVTRSKDEEFATASIANEVWAVGGEHLHRVVDGIDPVAASTFAAEVCDSLGRCDAAIIATGPCAAVDFDELSRDEWVPMAAGNLTAPMMLAQAFGRVVEREGRGSVVFVTDPAQADNVPGRVIAAAIRALAESLREAWAGRGLQVPVVDRDGAPQALVRVLGR